MLLIAIVFIGSLLPALVWLFFFLHEDLHPEPRRLLFHLFGFGALASIPALAAQLIFQRVIDVLGYGILIVIGLALIEETFKFLAAYLGVYKNRAFDEPVDAMIYMVVAALGFATIENVFILWNTLDSFDVTTLELTLETLALRLIGATLLHALVSALVGYYWARGTRGGTVRSSLVFGLVIATIVHSIFNYLILTYQTESLIVPTIFLVGFMFFILDDFEKLKEPQHVS